MSWFKMLRAVSGAGFVYAVALEPQESLGESISKSITAVESKLKMTDQFCVIISCHFLFGSNMMPSTKHNSFQMY